MSSARFSTFTTFALQDVTSGMYLVYAGNGMFTLSAVAPLPTSFSIYYAHPAATQAIGILTFVPPTTTSAVSARAFFSVDGWAACTSSALPAPPSFLITPAFDAGGMKLVAGTPAYIVPFTAQQQTALPCPLPQSKVAAYWSYVPLSNAYWPTVATAHELHAWGYDRRSSQLLRVSATDTSVPFEVCNVGGTFILAALGSQQSSNGVVTVDAWCGMLPVQTTTWTATLLPVTFMQSAAQLVPPANTLVLSVNFDNTGQLVFQCSATPGINWYLASVVSGTTLALSSSPSPGASWTRDTTMAWPASYFMAVTLGIGVPVPTWPLPSSLPVPARMMVGALIHNNAILQADGQTYAPPQATSAGASMQPCGSYCAGTLSAAGSTESFSYAVMPHISPTPVFVSSLGLNTIVANGTPVSVTYTLQLSSQFAWTGMHPTLTFSFTGSYDCTPYAFNALSIVTDAAGMPWFTVSMNPNGGVPVLMFDLITTTLTSLIADTTTAAFANTLSCALPAIPFQIVNSNVRAGVLGPPGSTDSLYNLTGLGTHMVVQDNIHMTAVSNTADVTAATFTFQSASDADGVLAPWLVLTTASAGPLTVLAQGVTSQYEDGRLTPQSMQVQVAAASTYVPNANALHGSMLLAANAATAPRWAVALPGMNASVPGPVVLLFQMGPYGQILAMESGSMNFGQTLNDVCSGSARLWGGNVTVQRSWLPYGPLIVTNILMDTAQVAVAITPPADTVDMITRRRHVRRRRTISTPPVTTALWQNAGLLTPSGQQQLILAKTQFWLYVTQTVPSNYLTNICTASTLAPVLIPWPTMSLVQPTISDRTITKRTLRELNRAATSRNWLTPAILVGCIVGVVVLVIVVGTCVSYVVQKRQRHS